MADTETIDRLFLELSQFTSAKTARELDLERQLADMQRMRDERDMELIEAERTIESLKNELPRTETLRVVRELGAVANRLVALLPPDDVRGAIRDATVLLHEDGLPQSVGTWLDRVEDALRDNPQWSARG